MPFGPVSPSVWHTRLTPGRSYREIGQRIYERSRHGLSARRRGRRRSAGADLAPQDVTPAAGKAAAGAGAATGAASSPRCWRSSSWSASSAAAATSATRWLRDVIDPRRLHRQGHRRGRRGDQGRRRSPPRWPRPWRTQGVVNSARAFTNAIGAAGKSSSLQPGDYKMRKGCRRRGRVKLLDPKQPAARARSPRGGPAPVRHLRRSSRRDRQAGQGVQQAARNGERLGLPRTPRASWRATPSPRPTRSRPR